MVEHDARPQGESNGQGAPPQLINGYQVDKLTSWSTVQAVLAALFARAAGKSRGQHVEIAMLDVGANFFWPDGMALTGEMLVDKDPSTFSGGRPSRRPPQQLMPTKDGHGVLMIWPEAPHFDKALKAFLPELACDARFAAGPNRSVNFRAFQDLLKARIATMTNAELVEFCTTEDLPGNVVIDLAEFHKDPQVVHNGLLVEHEVGGLGAIREPRPAPLFSATPLRIGGAAPRRGEHTAAVLGEFGFTAAEVDDLRAAGVFGRVT
jgi:crotonobetainyl-CoA:carnitine CoA-transferase CaiB-like acyl-CoA transferase